MNNKVVGVFLALVIIGFVTAMPYVYNATHSKPPAKPDPSSFNLLIEKVPFNEPHVFACGDRNYRILIVEAGWDKGHEGFIMTYEGYHGDELRFTRRGAPGSFVTACHKFVVVKNPYGEWLIKVYRQ